MKIVGLAGGIACGKSSVSSLLREEHGIPVVDADAIAHAVLAPGTFATRSVASAFGPSVLRSDAGSATDLFYSLFFGTCVQAMYMYTRLDIPVSCVCMYRNIRFSCPTASTVYSTP